MRWGRILLASAFWVNTLGAAVFDSSKGPYQVEYDEAVWQPVTQQLKENSDQEWALVSGKGYALAIYEDTELKLPILKEAVLANMRQHDPVANVVNQDVLQIQGRTILRLEIEASYNGIPFTYVGYFHSGSEGTIQLIAFTTANFVHVVEENFTSLLKGLRFRDVTLNQASKPKGGSGRTFLVLGS
jgi:hypothetical protein